MKYITRIGQKTGTSKTSKKVKIKAITVAFTVEYLQSIFNNIIKVKFYNNNKNNKNFNRNY